ncbi:MAG: (2Fe-2S)-binding protein, partial [Acidobacteria bacterium]|nr:(2Fe-2S)-binding protein [Acidobacteriota bacterium]
MKKISFFIDGKEVTTTEGKTILEAALENGIDIPHFCYHDSLGKDGNCRICLVEIENNPKLVTSCTTPVMEGMKVLANSEHARKGRAGVMEFILLNHPLDCPVCDKAGECILQNYSYDHGYGHSRLEYPKEHFPVKDLGPDIYLWTERCIKCGRCIRFLEDIAETGELGFRKRGVKTELDIFDGVPIDNPVSLNIVDICPVGALLDKDFLYKARVWDLKSTESICPGCSAGCNIKYWSLDNILQRITARSNKGVNDHWLCNEGRRTYKNVDTEDRLVRHSLKGGKTVKLDEALEKLINTCETYKDKEGAGSIVAIGSPYLTNEENYLIKKLFGDNLGAKVSLFPARVSGKDQSFGGGFKIKAEKAPNYKGAQAALGLKNDNFQKIIDEIDKGSIKCVIAFNGDPELNLDASALKALKKAKFISLCEPHPSELNKTADIIFAGNMPAEKDGTFTNDKGITQRIRRAVYKPLDSEPEWQILLELAAQWNQECKAKHPL